MTQRELYSRKLEETSARMLAGEVENIPVQLPHVDEDFIEQWLTSRTHWIKGFIQTEVDSSPEKKPCPDQNAVNETVRKWIASLRGEK